MLLVSAVQQSESVIYLYTYIHSFRFYSYRSLKSIEESPVLYSRFLQ